ncbi:hypothetical protein F4694_000159 [Bacillus niacini]|uniref:Uncharacterized protein n=1 Tax=Neobacillus niacini TaxID=86668 RepID=A0A852T424_9BACI|nr:hypothetical protein [Neobacillus niacini]NYE03440.1 hypothetical protein [Neobacillus niacini]
MLEEQAAFCYDFYTRRQTFDGLKTLAVTLPANQSYEKGLAVKVLLLQVLR